ncbi:MAG: hypothetical protein KAI55_00850 [Candidatus Aenigmarchaeota archaeon]|nr:hypothetical protein [Candidatus Aenigmarchaeota archaeon]
MKDTNIQKELKIAGYAGIVNLALMIPILAMSFMRIMGSFSNPVIIAYIISSIITIMVAILFFRGFILIGEKLQNQFLVKSSYIIVITTIIFCIYDMLSLGFPFIESELIAIVILFLMGIINIFFGIGIYKLKDKFGNIAIAAGILEIIMGIMYSSILLVFIAIILTIPVVILEIIILFRAADKFAEKKPKKETSKVNQESK